MACFIKIPANAASETPSATGLSAKNLAIGAKTVLITSKPDCSKFLSVADN